ncbi:MAG: ThuA domain-containing protein [Verrucomicrobiota bacterium]
MLPRSFILVSAVFIASLPAMAQKQFSALVVALPSEYHFEYISVARESFRRLAEVHHFELEFTSVAWPVEGDLSGYDAIVFLNTNAGLLNEDERANFQRYIRSGKGFVAVHWAVGRREEWEWYADLVGRSFTIHPIIQSGVAQVEDGSHPATLSLPERFVWTDEWYEVAPAEHSGLHTLLSVDESTYDPTWIWPGQEAHGMGADHPVSWCHEFEGSRVFVTTLGHLPAAYAEPRFLDHLYGALYWAATGRGWDRGEEVGEADSGSPVP